MKISEKGLELIKSFEGLRLTAYKPVAAETYYTIGYGHYGPDVKKGMTITAEQAEEYLLNDIAGFETTVEHTCSYLPKLTQNEFDALVSFTYNCGSGGLLQLTANKTRTKAQMMEHITAYTKGANGKELPGLVKRRAAEKALFLEKSSVDAEKFDYLGITRFHELGYKGEGISFVSRETLSVHGRKVYDIMKLVAPEADLYYGKEYSKDVDESNDVYTTSYFKASDEYSTNKKKSTELFNNDVFLVCAIGNDAEESTTELSKQPWWASVGACTLKDGKPARMYYSGVSKDIDFMSLTNITTENGLFTGTSCAAPMFAGMCVLVQCFFKKNIGRKLTNLELLEFIKDNCVDLQAEGFDNFTGYGLFRLPDPNTIDLSKYKEEEEMRYQTLEEIPEWGKPTIEKLIKREILKGNEKGLDLSEDMLRMLVILDRANTFNVDPAPVWEAEDERPGSEPWDEKFNL